MSNRTYRLVVGALLLIFLYYDLNFGIYALIVVLFLEGMSNFLLPDIFNRIRYTDGQPGNDENLAPIQNKSRFSFSAERAWRLVVAFMLMITFVLFNTNLSEYVSLLPLEFIEKFSYINWFLPWFMGFAIFGAGISGVCPVLITVKWIGFK